MKPQTGTSMSRVVNVRKERENLTPLEANCKKCLYFPHGRCTFGLKIEDGKCFKFEHYVKPKGQSNHPEILCKLCKAMIPYDRKRIRFTEHLQKVHNISFEQYDKKYRY